MPTLVLDNFLQLVINNPVLWNKLALTVPEFGRYTFIDTLELIDRLVKKHIFEKDQKVYFSDGDYKTLVKFSTIPCYVKYCYTFNTTLHRVDGPAIKHYNGTKE